MIGNAIDFARLIAAHVKLAGDAMAAEILMGSVTVVTIAAAVAVELRVARRTARKRVRRFRPIFY